MMIISYNAIEQLDITGNNNNCLVNILNNCNTAIGKRKYKEILLKLNIKLRIIFDICRYYVHIQYV